MNQIATAAAWFSIFFEKAFVKRVKRLMPVSAPSRLLDRRSVRLLKSERSTPHQEMKRIRIFYALSTWKRTKSSSQGTEGQNNADAKEQTLATQFLGPTIPLVP